MTVKECEIQDVHELLLPCSARYDIGVCVYCRQPYVLINGKWEKIPKSGRILNRADRFKCKV